MDGTAPGVQELSGGWPWFLGGAWMTRFDGSAKGTYQEWRRVVGVGLRAQSLSAVQQVDFVLSALEGEARREVELLRENQRDTAEKILEALDRLYGEGAGLAQLRVEFFTCQQQSGEGVGSFILRLRECHYRWRKKEPVRDEDDDDATLRSQLVTGLLAGSTKRELQRLIRRASRLTFMEACREVKEMEKEEGPGTVMEGVDARRTFLPLPTAATEPATAPSLDLETLRSSLREDLLREMSDQVRELKQVLEGWSQVREGQASAPGTTLVVPPSRRRGRTYASSGGPRWDEQGRPICLRCGEAGHMVRSCPRGETTVVNSRGVQPEASMSTTPVGLREALVGESPVLEVLAAGRLVPCILDTGSQVTLFSRSIFNQCVKGIEVKGAAEVPWLALKAVNGLSLPYVGYVVLDFTVAGVEIPQRGVVIVEDQHLPAPYGILGMNVIRHCWEVLQTRGGAQVSLFRSALPQSDRRAWDQAFTVCRRLEAAVRGPVVEQLARLRTEKPWVLSPATEKLIWADVPRGHLRDGDQVLVEDYRGGQQEWCVARAVARVCEGRVPLRICNLHQYPVELPPRRPLARVEKITAGCVQPQKELVLRQPQGGVVDVEVRPVAGALPEQLHALVADSTGLTREEGRQLQELLERWQRVFARDEEDHGCTDVVYHCIPTGVAVPSRERYRPVPPSLYPELRELLKSMLEGGVITESASPWAAPIVLVRKKDGSWRFCVDYRKLNAVTHKDAYPLPRIEESLTGLKGAAWYSTLDLASGYWQVEVHPNDKEKTAFTTPMGLYQFERMPFGLCNAPATFQRLMQRCLGEQVYDYLLIYLDDVIVYSPDFGGHLEHLEKVFARLEAHGLKLQPEKCRLFQRAVRYLGHIVSREGVTTDPEKTEAVRGWPRPGTVREVRSFLGFVGYYRRFVPGFAKRAAALHGLLKGAGSSSRQKIEWTKECEEAFQALKEALLEAPVLAYADYTLPFRLYTDASLRGLGAVLTQVQGGQERVIAYASRSLHEAERNDQNYSAFKLELLALKWAVVEKFKDYLWGARFEVFTDHRPLLHLKTAKLGAVEQRWAGQLASFDYELRHKPGREHQNADALSRRSGMAVVAQIGSIEDWAERQSEDSAVAQIRQWVLSGERPTVMAGRTVGGMGRCLLEDWELLRVDQGVLRRRSPVGGEESWAVVVPEKQRQQVWLEYHRALGHARGRRMVLALQERFYWPGMRRDVEQRQRGCQECLIGSRGKGEPLPLGGINTSYPWEVLAVDYLSMGRPGDTYPYVLVAIDLFSRFAFAVPTRDQTAATAARVIWGEVIQRYGCPERLLSDQGPAFESQLVKELCEVYGCRKVRTTPYHPQGNGACERWNQTLLRLLNTLSVQEQGRWAVHLPELVQAYNCTPHSSTGLSPFWVLFGRQPRLPIDQRWGTCDLAGGEAGSEWVRGHRRRMWAACKEVERGTERRRQGDRRYHNVGKRRWLLAPGDRVLVRNFRRRAGGKVSPYWQTNPWVVVRQRDLESPVFQLRPDGREGPLRTLHRRHLRPCPPGWISVTPEMGGELRRAGVCPRPGPSRPRGWPGDWEEPWAGTAEQVVERRLPAEDGEPVVEVEPVPEVVEPVRRSQRANFGIRPARYRE
ncbi:uncharacterized protein LOC125711303 [Brienomyrus brachyistius]|uniref:uncharacterized protein LOC125711303 n=1 Tax=Brienomyrus brachyistius TaxID=42636 RepID=UPI0020B2E99F|nr:uncharacterized protein LOC125711303 [Brienomyrus brachyistius]